jgi:4-hydroxy-2-oxoheptanedioate aldolase
MRSNKILTRMREGKPATGCQLAFPSGVLIELMGVAGLDFVLLDGEHGTFSWESLEDMCRVADLAEVTAIARVPNIEESTILRYLDRGVQGILGPGIDTGAEAQQLVDACYYAPLGRRGLGGAPRAADYATLAGRDYLEGANAETLVVAFLEHVEAIDNLDDILAVDGIDAFYVGPQDMSVSLGFGGQPDHPRIGEITAQVKEAAEAAGKRYFGDVVVADRATNFFLKGIEGWLEDNKARLS